jgi:hypothetical protein
MDASASGEPPDFQQDRTESSGRDARRQEDTLTLPMFVAACCGDALRTRMKTHMKTQLKTYGFRSVRASGDLKGEAARYGDAT